MARLKSCHQVKLLSRICSCTTEASHERSTFGRQLQEGTIFSFKGRQAKAECAFELHQPPNNPPTATWAAPNQIFLTWLTERTKTFADPMRLFLVFVPPKSSFQLPPLKECIATVYPATSSFLPLPQSFAPSFSNTLIKDRISLKNIAFNTQNYNIIPENFRDRKK